MPQQPQDTPLVMKTLVNQIRIGKAQPYGPNGEPSAHCKTQVSGSVAIGLLGLAGDEQADLKKHGGVDKAILHYACDHYAAWLRQRPELSQHFGSPGAFGENISTVGLTEATICIGDRFRLGTGTVEVSQGRKPCWKLSHRFGSPEMVRDVVRTGKGGWYYRVIETGYVSAGDSVELVDRPCPEWPVSKVTGLLLGDTCNPDELSELAQLELLSKNWQQRAADKFRKLLGAPTY